MKEIIQIFVLSTTISLFGCGHTDRQGDSEQRKLDRTESNKQIPKEFSKLVLGTGEISRRKTEYTYNEEIHWSDQAHFQITVRCYKGEDVGAPITYVQTGNVKTIPFNYLIEDTESSVFPVQVDGMKCYHYLIAVQVFNHEGSAPFEGDLISESSNKVEGAGFRMDVSVSGLESCESPNAGGFCTNRLK
ncbi:MAG: hypothetical protein NT027_09000 [Proteobacteria bacterium]|nr:hypothetical protein [Pseudomonadota bacterium]